MSVPMIAICTELDRSNSLVDLAHRINAEHTEIGRALKAGIEHAIVAGELLIEAKRQLKHGQWLPWLREHCQISERTASLYMRLARHKVELEAKSATVADLTVNDAIALLAPPTEQDPSMAKGEAIANRIREANHAVMEAVAEKMLDQRTLAIRVHAMSPEEREAFFKTIDRRYRALIPRWRHIDDDTIADVQLRISCLF